jgi:hypothetical protein
LGIGIFRQQLRAQTKRLTRALDTYAEGEIARAAARLARSRQRAEARAS